MAKRKAQLSASLVTIVSLLGIGFVVGIVTTKYVPFLNKSHEILGLKKQLQTAEEEAQLCMSNAAKTTESITTGYGYEKFGIFSPLFEGKDIINTILLYKRQTIIEKNIALTVNKHGNTSEWITVWEYPNWKNEDILHVFLNEYESIHKSPTDVKLTTEGLFAPENTEVYTNKHNKKMYFSYQYCPKFICAVKLHFFTKFTPNGNAAFVEIAVSNSEYPKEDSINNPGVLKAKARLKEIADTVEDYSTRH